MGSEPAARRIAIATGAARGLGEAIARRLHSDGFRVALTDIDVEGVERVAAALGAQAFEHDVRELDSWEQLLAQLDDVHVLVNNAARTEFRSFFEIDLDEWDDVIATNLRGTYLGCRVVGARMRERGAGRIVNLASDAAFATSGGELEVSEIGESAVSIAYTSPRRLCAMLRGLTGPPGTMGRRADRGAQLHAPRRQFVHVRDSLRPTVSAEVAGSDPPVSCGSSRGSC